MCLVFWGNEREHLAVLEPAASLPATDRGHGVTHVVVVAPPRGVPFLHRLLYLQQLR